MIFIGNCAYEPPGFAPTTRSRLDDGSFDVRIVDGSHPYARLRLIAAALTGNLARSRVYTRRLVDSIDFVVHDDNHTLAADGEVFAGHTEFRVAKHTRRLLVYAPE
jgi:diacylglycerol kinase family enzyme